MPFFSIAGTAPKVATGAVWRLDEETFRIFYDRTARPLRAYLLSMLSDHAAADDLLQESYLRLLRAKRPDVETDEHLKNYLFRIATNLVKDHKARRQEAALEDLAAPARTHDGDVTRMLASLKPTQRELLWLAYVEKFSHGEIATMLRLKPQSIRPLLSRARAALAEALRRGGFGDTK
jgi:RNA polymerase sigma-70 factor (ECF subfamily)